MNLAPSEAAREAIKHRFYDEGVSVVDWARERGFDVHLVYGVLSGRSRATRGESHRIAVALGLKGGVVPSLVKTQPGRGAGAAVLTDPGSSEVERCQPMRT